MGKELIRNGGFERGNIDFWEMQYGKSMVIESTEKHSGLYSLKGVVRDLDDTFVINTKDYIKVSGGSVYRSSIWLYNVDLGIYFTAYLRFYDSNKTLITEYGTIGQTTGTGVWEHFAGYAQAPEGAIYARLSFWATGTGNDQYAYIDEVSLQDVENISVGKEILINVINETTKHTVVGSEFFSGIWKEAEYFFDLTSFTETVGANPVTIDVKIESYDPETDTWRDAMVFQQKSCPASGNVTTQEYKRLVGGLGWKQRVSYTTAGAGTIGDCDFKVGVVYKR